MDDWGDREVYLQKNEERDCARTCLAMSLIFIALVLILVVVGVVLVAVVGLLL